MRECCTCGSVRITVDNHHLCCVPFRSSQQYYLCSCMAPFKMVLVLWHEFFLFLIKGVDNKIFTLYVCTVQYYLLSAHRVEAINVHVYRYHDKTEITAFLWVEFLDCFFDCLAITFMLLILMPDALDSYTPMKLCCCIWPQKGIFIMSFRYPLFVLSRLPLICRFTAKFLLLARHFPTAPLALSVSKNWHEPVSNCSFVACTNTELKSAAA